MKVFIIQMERRFSVACAHPAGALMANMLSMKRPAGQPGHRVLDLETNKTTTLTTERDNLPFFSPDGEWVLFTRNVTLPERGQFSNYEVCIIRPNGTDFTWLTSSPANDAHAVWTADGRILWSTGMFGFQAEAATYDNTFHQYGQIMVMNVDGSNKTLLTNSLWEDSMPLYVPNAFLKAAA